MNPTLYHKLVERKIITQGVEVAVEYNLYQDCKKVKTVKGLYIIDELFSSPLIPGTFIRIKNETDEAVIEPINIKLIKGLTAIKIAAEHGIRPDGKDDSAPKRRGRKPKDRSGDAEWALDAEDEELDEEIDEELDEVAA